MLVNYVLYIPRFYELTYLNREMIDIWHGG